MLAEFKISLPPVTDETAAGEAKTILDASIALRGRASNMYRAMANSEGLLSTYAHGYEAFRQGSGFSSHEQEVVLLTISRENSCHYCSAVHSFVADKAIKLEPDILAAVRAGTPLADAKLQALAVFTSRLFETRGLVSKDEAATFLAAGYSEQQILEIILAISIKTLSNYSNHIFHTELDAAFVDYAP